MRTALFVALTLAASSSSALAADFDEAGDEEVAESRETAGRRSLAERIPAVTRRVFAKKGRVEITPTVGLALNDPFYEHVIVSGAAAYHVTEWLWLGASADVYGSFSESVPVIGVAGQAEEVDYTRPTFAARVEAAWAPFYGKLSLLAESVFHFDTYVAVGGGMVGKSQGSSALAATVALGQHFFLNDWLALRAEVRDQIFTMSRAPSLDEELQNLLTVSFGLSLFFPTAFEREAL